MPELRDRRAAGRRGCGQAFPEPSRPGEGERAVRTWRERPYVNHRTGVQRAVDVREGQFRPRHVLVPDLGAQQAGVDHKNHQVAGDVAVEFVRCPGHLRSLGGVDKPLLGEGLVHRGPRVLAVLHGPLPVGAGGNVVDDAAHARHVTTAKIAVAKLVRGTDVTLTNHSANPYVSFREERYCLWASAHRTRRLECMTEALREKELDCHGFAAA